MQNSRSSVARRTPPFHPVLNQDGAGSFKIHRSDPDVATYSMLSGGLDGCIVHLLRKGPLEADFHDRFSFVVESVGFGLDQQEEQSAWITVAGRGTLCLLEDRISFPPGFDGINPNIIANQWQVYAAVGGGAIMDGEIDRSACAGAHAYSPDNVDRTIRKAAIRQPTSAP